MKAKYIALCEVGLPWVFMIRYYVFDLFDNDIYLEDKPYLIQKI